jgi:hypothetical protein
VAQRLHFAGRLRKGGELAVELLRIGEDGIERRLCGANFLAPLRVAVVGVDVVGV